ncbi:MAG: NAD(P)H-dependent glycerol-3-phosphate dehydrogenase [Acidimicrobiia bacterium]
MSMRVAVVGAGSWGTTLAARCARRGAATLWARRPELAAEVDAARVNAAYLPGVVLPPSLEVTASLERAVAGAELVLLAVPTRGMRATAAALAGAVAPGVPVVSLAKGLEAGTRRRMSEVVAEELPGHPVGVLTGPNLSHEIAAGRPAAAVVAVEDHDVAEAVGATLRDDVFRVYTNHDVVGCEVAGALKNVIAIAAGMAAGLGTGDNALAAVITRGLAELTRLGVAMGGEAQTFAGLAGVGDLVATCTSGHSRNRWVGEQLGRGRSLAEATAELPGVAEGVATSAVVVQLAAELGVEVPLSEEVRAVCHDGRSAREAYRRVLARDGGAEVRGLARR